MARSDNFVCTKNSYLTIFTILLYDFEGNLTLHYYFTKNIGYCNQKSLKFTIFFTYLEYI